MITTKRTEQQEQFIQLRAQGKSYNDISAELGISKGSCSNWAKRYAAEIERAAANTSLQESPEPKQVSKSKKKVDGIIRLPVKHFFSKDFADRAESGELTEEELKQLSDINTEIDALEHEVELNAHKTLDFSKTFPIPLDEKRIAEHWQSLITNTLDNMESELSNSTETTIESFIDVVVTRVMEEWSEFFVTEVAKKLPPEQRKELLSRFNIKPAATAATIQNIIFDKAFAMVFSETVTNQLSTINTTIHKPEIDPVTGNAAVKLGNAFTLHIENYRSTGREWKVSTIKLLHICTIILTESNHYREKNPDAIKQTVSFTVSDYMKLTGKSNTKSARKEARATIRKDLDTLSNSSIDWTEKSKRQRGSEKAYLNTPILGGSYGIDKHGNVIVTFSRQFAEYLVQEAYLMQYALPLLKTDERNANTYPLGCKLTLHSSIDHNIKAGTDKIISVKKALEICPNIPTYEELIARKERHWERCIKDSLEKALDSLTFAKWEYCNAKGQPLTDEQLADNRYSSFIGLYIHFDLIGAPDQTKRLKAKAERASKRKARNDTKRTAKTEGASRHKSGQACKGKE